MNYPYGNYSDAVIDYIKTQGCALGVRAASAISLATARLPSWLMPISGITSARFESFRGRRQTVWSAWEFRPIRLAQESSIIIRPSIQSSVSQIPPHAQWADNYWALLSQSYRPELPCAPDGLNHEGSLAVAKEMADAARRAGARLIKHQTHIVEDEMCQVARSIQLPKPIMVVAMQPKKHTILPHLPHLSAIQIEFFGKVALLPPYIFLK